MLVLHTYADESQNDEVISVSSVPLSQRTYAAPAGQPANWSLQTEPTHGNRRGILLDIEAIHPV